MRWPRFTIARLMIVVAAFAGVFALIRWNITALVLIVVAISAVVSGTLGCVWATRRPRLAIQAVLICHLAAITPAYVLCFRWGWGKPAPWLLISVILFLAGPFSLGGFLTWFALAPRAPQRLRPGLGWTGMLLTFVLASFGSALAYYGIAWLAIMIGF